MELEEGKEAQSPVVRRTSNHIYEHCGNTTVIGMKAKDEDETRLILQFARDMTELADGTTKNSAKISTIRHTFATFSMDKEAAIQLAESIIRSYDHTFES